MTRRSDENVRSLPRFRQRGRGGLPRIIHLALGDAQLWKSTHQHLPLALVKLPRPKRDGRPRQMLIQQPNRPRHPPAVADVFKLKRLADEDVRRRVGVQRGERCEQQSGEEREGVSHGLFLAFRRGGNLSDLRITTD